MNNLRILFLGWDFLPDNEHEPETNCYGVAKAMANQVNLSLILPKADSNVYVDNVHLIGLNQVNFNKVSPARNAPKVQPFAESAYIRPEIPLYGAPNLPENQRAYSPERTILSSASSGTASTPNNSNHTSPEIANFFEQVNWDQLHTEGKVIQYARFVARFAANSDYDVIFASNWLTYLAGNELHLITGKPLAIQMNTLSQDHRDLNNQGWRYELEKMVIERASYIFTPSLVIADCLEAAYPVTSDKIFYLEDATLPTKLNSIETGSLNLWQSKEDQQLTNYLPMDQPLDWENQANKMVQVLTESYA
ncbi:hypothetical protein HUW51_02575 [Adhaeribacter swui]|uniref:Glycosyltransferase n=1 Tax=Adhaeribacter swui TaxID=2086471 RepID=A0A7G7G3C9_9BACT|nr:hypothetical protein [Adhaeribacter swui]QNF31663.1 hypothetical protein HUW51_02575 [Adhaeribacter swui]